MQKVLGIVCGVLLVSAAVACGGGDKPPPNTASSSGGATPDATAAAKPTGPTKPDSDKVTWKNTPPAKSCHTGAKAGDVSANVAAMSAKCMPANMKRVGAANTGAGTPDKMVTQIPLKASANHCYRVVGIAEPTVTDFDIAIMDSAGKEIGEDVLDSNDAVVLEDGVFCFNADDAASVNVAVANGTGKWAVEVWSD